MKKVIAWILGYFIAACSMVLMVGMLSFLIFWFFVGLVSFATWSLPATLPSIWVIARVCISIGVLVSLFFIFSEEGKSVAKDFIKDEYK